MKYVKRFTKKKTKKQKTWWNIEEQSISELKFYLHIDRL